jgi:hypothetical protein
VPFEVARITCAPPQRDDDPDCGTDDGGRGPEGGKMSHLVHNEQMKLAANLFNNLAVVSLASGFIAPVFSVRPSATPISVSAGGYADLDGMTINILLGIFLGLVFCLVFEFVAHSFLLKLKE